MVKLAIDKMLAWLKIRNQVKMHFSSRVAVAFISRKGHAFIPLQPLTRALLVQLLGVVQRKLDHYDEAFTFLQQA